MEAVKSLCHLKYLDTCDSSVIDRALSHHTEGGGDGGELHRPSIDGFADQHFGCDGIPAQNQQVGHILCHPFLRGVFKCKSKRFIKVLLQGFKIRKISIMHTCLVPDKSILHKN